MATINLNAVLLVSLLPPQSRVAMMQAPVQNQRASDLETDHWTAATRTKSLRHRAPSFHIPSSNPSLEGPLLLNVLNVQDVCLNVLLSTISDVSCVTLLCSPAGPKLDLRQVTGSVAVSSSNS